MSAVRRGLVCNLWLVRANDLFLSRWCSTEDNAVRGGDVARPGKLVPTVKPSLRVRSVASAQGVPVASRLQETSVADESSGGKSGLPARPLYRPQGLQIYADKYPQKLPPQLMKKPRKELLRKDAKPYVYTYALQLVFVPVFLLLWYYNATRIEPTVDEPQRPFKFDYNPEIATITGILWLEHEEVVWAVD